MARPLLRPLCSCRNAIPSTASCSSRIYLRPIIFSVPRQHIQLHQPSPLSNHRRLYHSQYHPDPPAHEYTNSQTAILTAALRHVSTHGFTRDALTLGARDTGFLDVSIQLLPRGEIDLILFWLASRRGLLRAAVEQNGLLKSPDSDFVSVEKKTRALIMERLRMNADIKHQWQDALALMSFPSHIPLSLSELHALSSDILHLAGDTSVDASWYTKRLSVSAIYASAEVVMTRDLSPDLAVTEAFVTRRIEDSKAIGDKLTGVKQCLGFIGSTVVGLGRSWGMKI
ncbi:COQ9-domain-containing protein [Aspergillus pseudoustus]|uniref:Ubiquinone biosynthesis protein n=1 Tax=Aspergillus pseudoustus TaxID=1810923 RepID=A0ABR4KNH9_9EURO